MYTSNLLNENLMYNLHSLDESKTSYSIYKLYLLTETIISGSKVAFLNVITFAAILCGIAVIICKNPIVSVLFLIGLFLSIAGYLMMLGINFIGLSYLLVYVGAVSILFLFILMLINVRISELVSDTDSSIPLAILIGIIFNLTTYTALPSVINNFSNYLFDINRNIVNLLLTSNKLHFEDIIGKLDYRNSNSESSHELVFVTSSTWDGSLAETSHITSLGNIIYTSYPIWLIITSIILLLAMVGAIVITIKPNK